MSLKNKLIGLLATILISSIPIGMANATSIANWYVVNNVLHIYENIAPCNSAELMYWYDQKDEINRVEIHDGITSVGSNSLSEMSKLNDISMPDSLEEIGEGAFSNDTSIKEVVFQDGIRKIEKDAFKGCSSLIHAVFEYEDIDVDIDKSTFDGANEGFYITSYAGNSVGLYCYENGIPFDSIGGSVGEAKIDLTNKKTILDPDNGVLYLNSISIASKDQKILDSGEIYYDLDGDGTYDIIADAKDDINLQLSDENSLFGSYNKTFSSMDCFRLASMNEKNLFHTKLKIETGKRDLSNATVGEIAKLTYNGARQFPTPDVVLNGKKLVSGKDYFYSYNNNENAGTATVVINGMGDYEGSITKNFTISKKNPTVSVKNKTLIYNKKNLKSSKKINNISVKTDANKSFKNVSSNKKAKKFAVNKNNGKLTLNKNIGKGSYKVKIKVVLSNGKNYNKLTKTVSYKIVIK